MRIASKFRDYYDVGQATGQDQTLVYRRYPKIVKIDHYYWSPPPGSYISSYSENGLQFELTIIGFCGRVYPALAVNTSEGGRSDKEERRQRRFCYTLTDVDKFVLDHFGRDGDTAYRIKKYQRKNTWPWGQRRFELERFFERFGEEQGQARCRFGVYHGASVC